MRCKEMNCNNLAQFREKWRTDSITKEGYTVAQLVEALRYKPEGRGFDSR